MLFGNNRGSNPGSPSSQLSSFSDTRPKSVNLKRLYFEKKAATEGLSIPVSLIGYAMYKKVDNDLVLAVQLKPNHYQPFYPSVKLSPIFTHSRKPDETKSFKGLVRSPRSAFSPTDHSPRSSNFQSIVSEDDSRNDTEDEFRSTTEGSESEN